MKKLKSVLGPSILSADFANLQKQCTQILELGADSLHIDIMDGHFVPNLTIGPPVVNSLRNKFPFAHLDCHLMVTDPQQYLQALGKAKVDCFTFHYEALMGKTQQLCHKIKKCGLNVGVSVKPQTKIDQQLIQLAKKGLIDKFLIMTVQPGFGGQSFMQGVMEKVKFCRQQFPEIDIQVDGGINTNTAKIAAENGANCFVAGSAIFGAQNRGLMIKEIKEAIQQDLSE